MAITLATSVTIAEGTLIRQVQHAIYLLPVVFRPRARSPARPLEPCVHKQATATDTRNVDQLSK